MQMVFLRSSRAMDELSSCWEKESFRQQIYRYGEINKCMYVRIYTYIHTHISEVGEITMSIS